MHALLRPARRRLSRPARPPAPPSRSSTATSTSCASGPPPGWRRCTRPGVPDARLYGDDPDDGVGGRGGVLPAARRAGGLRPAAGPGRHHPRPARDVGKAALAALALLAGAVAGFAGRRPMTSLPAPARRRRPARLERSGGRRRPDTRPAGADRPGAVAPQGRRRRRDERRMVPDATFTSYYGRPVVKASPWEADIPAYLFLGGLAAGSSLLAAGADLTGRPAAAAGRPARRARWASASASPRSGARPRSAGAVPPHAAGGQADLTDVGRHLDPHRVRPAGRAGRRRRAAGLLRPAGSAWPAGCCAWRPGRPGSPRSSRRRSPPTPRCCSPTRRRRPGTTRTASCRSSSSAPPLPRPAACGMVAVPVGQAGPARRLAVGGAVLELAVERPDGARDGADGRAAAPGAPGG